MYDYFFAGANYIVVQREDIGPGFILEEFPRPITALGWGAFGADGIDAALYSGSKCYFFDRQQYIRVTSNGGPDLGSIDPGYPRPISDWGWPSNFGSRGIDAAMWCGSVFFFFSGTDYIRSTRGDTEFGVVDSFYPKPINSGWDIDAYPGLNSFGTNKIDAALYSGSKCFLFSGTNYVRISKGDPEPGLFDTPVPSNISDWNWGDFGKNGIDAAFNNDGPLATPPSAGLTSNTNYFLHDNGNVLTNVTVELALDQGLISEANGWSVQLNCYSQNTPSIITEWQQYVIWADDTQVFARINNWENVSTELIQADVVLATMNSASLSPGSLMSFNLSIDANNNVTGCTFNITYEGSQTFSSTPGLISPVQKSVNMDITNLTTNISGLPPITSAELAPIVAMQLNIVGDNGLRQSIFNATSGSITYVASQPLTAVNTEPSFTTFNDFTGETSNMFYGPLPQSANTGISQSFYVPEQITTHPDAPAKEAVDGSAAKKGHALPLSLSQEIQLALKDKKIDSGLQSRLLSHRRDVEAHETGKLEQLLLSLSFFSDHRLLVHE